MSNTKARTIYFWRKYKYNVSENEGGGFVERKKVIRFVLTILTCLILGVAVCWAYMNQNFIMIERAKAEDIYKETEDSNGLESLEDRYMILDKHDLGEFSTLFEVYDKMKNDYVSELEDKTLLDGAIDGMLKSTEDVYTSYISNDSKKVKVADSLDSTYKGIGAEVALMGQSVIVTNPYKGSPAYNSGILPFDEILAVDEKSVKGMGLEEVVSLIKGKEGTVVKLKIRREQSEDFTLDVKREEIHIETVAAEVIEFKGRKIGLLEVFSFSENTSKEFKDQLQFLEEQKIEGLVIDVRDNGGGYLKGVKDIGSQLLPIGKPILKIENKSGKKDVVRSVSLETKPKPYPIAVLINKYSASASEVLATALKDSGGYTIIGETSFGKGTIQELIKLSDQSELKLTVAKWLTPNNKWIHETGIKPDINVQQAEIHNTFSIQQKSSISDSGVEENTKAIQVLLKQLGYEVPEEFGYMDDVTLTSLEKYENDNSIVADEMLDEKTVISLNQDLLLLKKDQTMDKQLNEALKYLAEK